MKLLVGTTNRGKLAEVRGILQELPLDIVSLAELSGWPKVEEDGKSFEENALKKARAFAEFSGCVTVADDSGLEVDALDGAPGILSARYSGGEGDDVRNNEKLLEALSGMPLEQRSARFVCVLALCKPKKLGGGNWLFRDQCEGQIAFEPKGGNGFGYDPLFFYPPFAKTFGEVEREVKGTVSHRGKALRKLKSALPSLFPLANHP